MMTTMAMLANLLESIEDEWTPSPTPTCQMQHSYPHPPSQCPLVVLVDDGFAEVVY